MPETMTAQLTAGLTAMTASELPSLAGTVTVVTGAGSGIGRATAILVSRRGGHVVLVGRRVDRLRETREGCTPGGNGHLLVPVDLLEPGASRQVVSRTLDRFDRLDGLVNNAGVARFGQLDDAADADVARMLDLHVAAPLRLIREAAPALRAVRGSVVNVSSIAGMVATPGRAAYGASKAALNHLTRSLARELAPRIRVNAVVPGGVETSIYDDLGLPPGEVASLRAGIEDTTPAGRYGQPEEVARWVCELLDMRSSWMTGCLLTVDGGRSC